MGLLDSMAETMIRTNATGQRVYFPFGMFGRARIVPNEQEENKIKSSAKRSVIIGSAAGLSLTILKMPAFVVFIVFLIGIIVHALVTYITARRYPIADERMTWAEARRLSVRKSDRGRLWVFFGLSVVMTALSAFATFAVFAMKHDLWDKIMVLCGVAFFGAGTVFLLWMIRQAGLRE